jgi:replication-associated recombination protein RarA
MEIIMVILTFIATIATIYGVMNNKKTKHLIEKSHINNSDVDENKLNNAPMVSILVEPKESARLYRATKKDASYLLFYVMIVNTGNEIIVIRNIEAIMSDEIGTMQQNKVNVIATHKGSRATYSIGITENLVPLSIMGNCFKDVYIAFEFQNSGIAISDVLIRIITSKGNITIPMNVEVIG